MLAWVWCEPDGVIFLFVCRVKGPDGMDVRETFPVQTQECGVRRKGEVLVWEVGVEGGGKEDGGAGWLTHVLFVFSFVFVCLVNETRQAEVENSSTTFQAQGLASNVNDTVTVVLMSWQHNVEWMFINFPELQFELVCEVADVWEMHTKLFNSPLQISRKILL